jgi:hypothetical protein
VPARRSSLLVNVLGGRGPQLNCSKGKSKVKSQKAKVKSSGGARCLQA